MTKRAWKKGCVAMLLLLLTLALLTPGVRARAGESDSVLALPAEYGDMLASLPEGVRSCLPDELFSRDANEQAAALEQFLSPESLLNYLLETLFSQLRTPLSLLLRICGVLLLRALLDCLGGVLGGGCTGAFSLLCRLSVGLLLMEQALSLTVDVSAYFEAIVQMTQAYLPLMSAMYLSGGNVAVAAVNQSTLLFATSLISVLGGGSVVSLVRACLAISLVSLLDGGVGARMGQLAATLKRWYVTALSLTMLLLGAVMAAQTTLAARSDSLTFKTVRFVVSSNIPYVGGGVAELLRSAATGVSWLRSLVGVGGVVMLLALLLPMVAQVLLCRMSCTLGADVAAWLGCPEEGRLLGELGGLYGFLLAVVALSSVSFFCSLVVFLKCAVAYG